MKCVIIGAGPTGLGAAWQLDRLGAPWVLFEAESHPGGISASFRKDGFTWDLGGHVVFSHYKTFTGMLDTVLSTDEWLYHERQAFIRIADGWVAYPIQMNIHELPEDLREECVRGLKDAAARAAARQPPSNFQEWIDQTAGDGLARLFMNPYNMKVWGYPPKMLSTQWVGERVAQPGPPGEVRNNEGARNRRVWGPNRHFRFPAGGGTGLIWDRLAAGLTHGRVRFGERMTQLDTVKKLAYFESGRTESYDALISTVPLPRLVEMAGLADSMPAVFELIGNSMIVCGFGVEAELPAEAAAKSWLYFPEAKYPFQRVTVLSNYSPANAPHGCYSLLAEVTESPLRPVDGRTVLADCIAGLKLAGLIESGAQVTHTWLHRIDCAYPVPTIGRDNILDAVLPALENRGVFSRGRFGAWKYEVGNMDHSFAQGLEVARRIVEGAEEVTLKRPDFVNSMAGEAS